jgi:hypothetical protein
VGLCKSLTVHFKTANFMLSEFYSNFWKKKKKKKDVGLPSRADPGCSVQRTLRGVSMQPPWSQEATLRDKQICKAWKVQQSPGLHLGKDGVHAPHLAHKNLSLKLLGSKAW